MYIDNLHQKIAHIKSSVNIEQVAGSYGIKVNRLHMAICPFHNDTKPSLKFYPDNGTFKCFSSACGKHGDVINLVTLCENISITEAVAKLLGVSPGKPEKRIIQKRSPQKVITPPAKLPDKKPLEIYRYFFDTLRITWNGRDYLNTRGISNETINRFHIKSQETPYMQRFLRTTFSDEELVKAGLFTVKGKYVFYQCAVIFPHFIKGEPVYFSTRNILGKEKYINLSGKIVHYYGNIDPAKPIFVFEGIIDALSLYELNGEDCFIALLGGIDRTKIMNIQKKFRQQLIIVYDNDISGALSRWDLETKGYIFDVLNFAKPQDDIYAKLRNDFKTIKEAKEYLFSDKGRIDSKYISEIKDLNEYLVERRSIME